MERWDREEACLGLGIHAADGAEERWDPGDSVAGHRELGMGIGSCPLGLRTGCVLGRH
jgi:hypothetical protein